MTASTADLEIDERLWIRTNGCEQRDFLRGNGHTSPGRMSAFCPHMPGGFSVTLSEIEDMSDESRLWIAGYLHGNEPRPELMFGDQIYEADDDDPRWTQWRAAVQRFDATGEWPDTQRRLAAAKLPRRRMRRGRWTSFVTGPVVGGKPVRGLHDRANPQHRLRVEHDEHTLLIHLSDEVDAGWTTIAIDRETRQWAVAWGVRQADAASEAYDRLYEP
jgi:hypothetical protein